jgi:hypothetical protein
MSKTPIDINSGIIVNSNFSEMKIEGNSVRSFTGEGQQELDRWYNSLIGMISTATLITVIVPSALAIVYIGITIISLVLK